MIPDLPVSLLVLLAVAGIGLIVAVKSLAMPKSFFKNQQKKEELRKILEKNKSMEETRKTP